MLVKSLKILALVAFAVFILVDPAFASDTLFTNTYRKSTDTFKNVRTIIFIVGGFGLVGLAFGAIFGRVNWKWFAALATGLLILAAAGAIVEYATEGDVSGGQDIRGLGDTFGNSQ